MGWSTATSGTQEDLIARLIRDEDWTLDGQRRQRHCLDHEVTLEGGYKVLWTVWDVELDKEGRTDHKRYIGCDLLDGLSYKDLCESMHPYYYSCPLRFLDMVPIEQYGGNAEWREICRSLQPSSSKKQ